ncbi:hypothetical protein [Blastococcus goldschmidtiae]|uniref:Uncharacterized protein n=1 Tax=Blastococcus goldschmidtiae TaxID=3075546 RepID=A0ABU2K9J6_9ACTN|nr:hypothetical protein [Blastococcus sp. DSM 46792]MDT0276866.1 hypothetical protein [Blastococcus sp. DSM 46792]
MRLDDGVDWEEVGELLTDSYCLLAPQRLAASVPRPEVDGSALLPPGPA